MSCPDIPCAAVRVDTQTILDSHGSRARLYCLVHQRDRWIGEAPPAAIPPDPGRLCIQCGEVIAEKGRRLHPGCEAARRTALNKSRAALARLSA